MNSQAGKLSVVIIGGGIGGANIARELSQLLDPTQHTLTLITSRQTYIYLPASIRALVNPDYPLATVFMPYDNLFGNFPGHLIHGTVTLIEENKRAPVSMMIHNAGDDGSKMCTGYIVYRVNRGGKEEDEKLERMRYDVLIVATGSLWEGFASFPNSTEESIIHIEIWRMKFKEANDIVIAGGGAVGLETAGEIKDIYPDKNVTIVHADRLPLNPIYPDRFRSLVERRLRARGVDFIFNDSIEGNPTLSSHKICTLNGISIPCDLFVPARGGRPSTLPLSFLSPSPLSSRGFVNVLPTLQIQYHPNIFAVGDIVDWPEIRQLVKIKYGHAGVVVSNVVKMLGVLRDSHGDGKVNHSKKLLHEGMGMGMYRCTPEMAKQKFKKYKGIWEIILITNGKSCGLTYCGLFGGFVLGDWWTRKLKSKDLNVNDARKALALDPL